jgi:hypothetical protein
MKPRYIYNTSDIGYMDEEWTVKTTELVEEKVEEKTNNQDEQEELKKVQ